MGFSTPLATAFLVLAVLLLSGSGVRGQNSTCPSDVDVRVSLCAAIFIADFQTAINNPPIFILPMCPEYWRTKSCILYNVMQCNSTVQTQYNSSLGAYANIFDPRCVNYNTSGGIPTQDPNCNMTAIFDQAMACIAPVQHTITYNYPATIAALNAFCTQYYNAWACAMGWIRPCSYAETYFNQTMESIKKQFDPYCGDPDEAEGAVAYAWVTPVAITVPVLLIALISLGVVLAYLYKKGMLCKPQTSKVKDAWPRDVKVPERFKNGHGPPLSTSIAVVHKQVRDVGEGVSL